MSTERFSKNIDRAKQIGMRIAVRKYMATLNGDEEAKQRLTAKYQRVSQAVMRMYDDDARRGKLPTVKPPLNRPAVISTIGDQITIKRGDRVRVYDAFGRCATPGEARLFAWLRKTAELWEKKPYVIEGDGVLFVGTVSTVWVSK